MNPQAFSATSMVFGAPCYLEPTNLAFHTFGPVLKAFYIETYIIVVTTSRQILLLFSSYRQGN